MRNILLFCFLVFYINFSFSQCPTDEIVNMRKTAIIFGERQYKFASLLRNPANDAQDMADSLQSIGFEVHLYIDKDFREMKDLIDIWCQDLNNFQIALFYYSGHASEVGGINYLFPIDANPMSLGDLNFMCYPVNLVLDRMDESRRKVSIMILDACRDNPFIKKWTRGADHIGINSMPADGVFIAYAAQPGHVALDGNGRNGAYTESLLSYITKQNMSLTDIFTKVNYEVRKKSRESQIPFYTNSLPINFCLSVETKDLNISKSPSSLNQPLSSISMSESRGIIAMTHAKDSTLYLKNVTSLGNVVAKKTPMSLDKLKISDEENFFCISKASKCFALFALQTAELKWKLDLAGAPESFQISNDQKRAFIACTNSADSGLIYVVDLIKKQISKTIYGLRGISQIALSKDNKFLYAITNTNRKDHPLFAIDVKKEKIEYIIEGVAEGNSIAISPDNLFLIIPFDSAANFSQTNLIDLSKGKLIKKIKLKSNGFAFTFDGKFLLSYNDSKLSFIRTNSYDILNSIEISAPAEGLVMFGSEKGILWLPGERRTYLFYVKDEVSVVDKNDADYKLKIFNQRMENSGVEEKRKKYEPLFNEIGDSLRSYTSQAIAELKGSFLNQTGSPSCNFNDLKFEMRAGIWSGIDLTKQIWPIVNGRVDGDKIIISFRHEGTGQEEEFPSFILHLDWKAFHKFVRGYYFARLDDLTPK